jgi:hypothetical protein
MDHSVVVVQLTLKMVFARCLRAMTVNSADMIHLIPVIFIVCILLHGLQLTRY